MSFHCDKLCSGECCFRLLKALALVLRDHVACAHIPNVARGDVFGATASMQAHAAINDPAKIVELMAMGLRARGHHKAAGSIVGDYMWISYVDDGELYDFAMHVNSMEHRHKQLLAIMHTTADPSSREACEKILRGNQ